MTVGPEKTNSLHVTKTVLAIANLPPCRWRTWFFERLAEALYLIDERHRRIAMRNLAIAFPGKTEKERRRIALASFRNLGRVLSEFPSIPRLHKGNIKDFIRLEGLENFQKAKEKGKGIIFLTAHFGNWEWMAAAFPLFTDFPVSVVFRPLDNPFFDRIVEHVRSSTGNHGIVKDKSMGRILRLLKKGGAIGILLDQNVSWQEGVFVKYFEEWACTNEGLALLALRTESAVLPVFNIRQGNGRYVMRIEPEVPLVRTGEKETDVQRNTQLFTEVIERYVREYPDHWLWLHQRWKTRPWQARGMKGTSEPSA